MLGLAVLAVPLAAQDTTALAVNAVHGDSLRAGDMDVYVVDLDSARFVGGAAEQLSVDVAITVRGPDGAVVRRFDGPARGPERFQFDAEQAGRYRLEVRAAKRGTAGRYRIVLTSVEPRARQPAARVDQLMAAYSGDDVPGGVVGVVHNGALIFAKAYGLANVAHGIPFRTETLTNIGSTSKQFTAFAIALLAVRGELSLDDDVRTHLPDLPDFGDTVRIRHLLTHTSGYREFLNTVALAGRRLDEGDHIGRSEIVGIVQRQPELQNAPGAEWNYNNTGFALLTLIVERVTGEAFATWMETNVFIPLGMRHAVVRAHPRQVIAGSAQGYQPAPGGGWREAKDLGGAMGAGGIYTTVGDLARWIRNFGTGEVGGPGLFERMTTRAVLSDGDTTEYGLGLFVDRYRGLTRIHHGGADVAHRSMLRYFPELDAGVIVLSNNATFPSGSMADDVAGAFFGDRLEPGKRPARAAVAFAPETYRPEDFDRLAGRYAMDAMPSFILTFTREEGRLFVQATGQPRVEILPTSDSTFRITVVPASITFHRGADGGADSLTLHQNGDHRARRVEDAAWAPAPEGLAAYAGRYFSQELETFYRIVVEDSALVLHHRRLDEPVTLRPGEKPDTFGGLVVAPATLVFHRDDSGAVTGFEVSNGRTRGVWFERVGETR